MKKKSYEKICPVCGQKFMVIGADQKEQIRYCSKSCSETGHRALASRLTPESVEDFSTALLRETAEEYKKNRRSRPEIENFVFSSWFQVISHGIDPDVFLHILDPEDNWKKRRQKGERR